MRTWSAPPERLARYRDYFDLLAEHALRGADARAVIGGIIRQIAERPAAP